MENCCSVSACRGLVVLTLLVFSSYCYCHDFKTTETDKERFCSEDSTEDGGICIAEEEHKYSQKSNENKVDLDGLSIELKLKELELNNSAKLEDLGIKPIEPITEWKSVEIPVVEAVKVTYMT